MQADDLIVQGLTDRTRNLLRALDRQDRLESAADFAGWLGNQGAEELSTASKAMLLRALAAVSDPVNYRLVTRLDPLSASRLSELMKETGLERIAVSERLNDLVQVGLVSRELIDDQIRATALATGLIAWVEDLAQRGGERLCDELQGAAPEGA